MLHTRKNAYLESIKTKNLCSPKDSLRHGIGWEAVLSQHIPDQALVPEIYKENLKLNNKKQATQLKKWAKDLNRHFTREDTQVTESTYRKRCLLSFVIRERQITTARYHQTPVRMAQIQKLSIPEPTVRHRVTGSLTHYWWECQMVQELGKQSGGFIQSYPQSQHAIQQAGC